MLSAVFRYTIPEISTSPVLKDLLRSFSIERPRVPNRVPPWDLSIVLRFLRSSAFEPLETIPLRELTKKVLFLTALASAWRVSELQAVSKVVSFSKEDIHLSFIPEFVAKTESERNPLPRSFQIKSLDSFVENLQEELLLCPVRALKIYVKRTTPIKPHPRTLFISPRNPSRPISKNAVSFFIREVIFSSYFLNVGSWPLGPASCSFRQVYGYFSSVSEELFTCCCTGSSNVDVSICIFFVFLRDVLFSSSEGFSLSPFVAANAII